MITDIIGTFIEMANQIIIWTSVQKSGLTSDTFNNKQSDVKQFNEGNCQLLILSHDDFERHPMCYIGEREVEHHEYWCVIYTAHTSRRVSKGLSRNRRDPAQRMHDLIK